MRYMPPSVFQPKVKKNGMHSGRSGIKTAVFDGSDVGSQNKGAGFSNESAAQALQRCIITNAQVPPDSPLAAVIPQTWQRMHTPQDRLETLTPQAFILVDKMLRYLAEVKEPAYYAEL